ncbi:LCP family protein [Candidatus Peregrinibacteria bacterium]|nr:LCP family protein [Candidatus Peregrinibacteria bacterium]
MPDQIPDYGDKAAAVAGQMNILIAGRHDSLVDTMIFANINPATRKITLVSIPRDLYYNNRKINSYYALYGMDELKRILSKITGFQIDKYILIDMYAFIDVIDLVGGIDVHLNEAVIDPTYKVCDNGECSTLYYRAGDHHLSGKQALRLARTRHTSSDFARADRQQTILKALQTKARQFGFGDAAKLTEIAKAVLAKTDTDLNLADAMAAYFRYQGFEVESGNVLSSGNVLESKYTGELKAAECKASKPASTEGGTAENGNDCKQDKGQYILLPRNNNWNTVRWYFHQLIEE